MLTALAEFARRGIAGTAISRVTKLAGARNSSALHYHFGSKDALVGELVRFVQQWFDTSREAPLAALEAAVRVGETIQLSSLLEAIVRPYARLIEGEEWGFSAIRFVAMLEMEQQQSGWLALQDGAATAIERVSALLAACRPGEDSLDRDRRLLFYIDSVIQGFAAHKHLRMSFIGDARLERPHDLADFYIACGERLLAP